MPSLKSSGPKRDSTLSGVVIEGGIAGADWATAVAQAATVARRLVCFTRHLPAPSNLLLVNRATILALGAIHLPNGIRGVVVRFGSESDGSRPQKAVSLAGAREVLM